MRRESLEDLPDPEVPAGLELRTFRAGDEGRWPKLMTGAIGDWNEESTARLFLSEPGVNPEGILFLAADDHYVATATDKQLEQAEVGYLHMVAAAPRYRGRGLGRCISIAALLHMRERGCRAAILDTDDYRLPAIRTYLALGFIPDIVEAVHSSRWHAVFPGLVAA